MAKEKSVPTFVPFRADAIAVSMPDSSSTIGRIMHYVPGMKVTQSYRQQFWAAVHAGTIDPEKEAWCLVWMHHLPVSAHPDAMAATTVACAPYPEWEKAVYGQSPRPK
ncbi:hypothetical protein [Streptomyces violens]|uniref:hypothetical protein n=1 Tax=Streptomyces violens TaxID=66377 RepID=UPI0004BFCB40|nr:hypothetical protein [Streptomyces violens]